MAFFEVLRDSLITASGRISVAKAFCECSAIALYFSTSESEACRVFTPKLSIAYCTNLHAKGLQIVFCSLDKDEAQFQTSFQSMLWPAVPFESTGVVTSLRQRFKVRDSPALVIVDATGDIILEDGVAAVLKDPTGEKYPWSTSGREPMPRKTTKQIMEAQAANGPCFALLPAVCCFWIPLLFFLGAANTLPTCESGELKVWMRTYSLLPFVSFAVMHIIGTFLACRGDGFAFKSTIFWFQGVTAILMVGMVTWGWVEYSKTSEQMCVGDRAINPRTLTLVFLVIECCLYVCCGLCAICASAEERFDTE